jgi:hypothetical protein
MECRSARDPFRARSLYASEIRAQTDREIKNVPDPLDPLRGRRVQPALSLDDESPLDPAQFPASHRQPISKSV